MLKFPSQIDCFSSLTYYLKQLLAVSSTETLLSYVVTCFRKHVGECVVYEWVERIRTFLQNLAQVESTARDVADMVLVSAGDSCYIVLCWCQDW